MRVVDGLPNTGTVTQAERDAAGPLGNKSALFSRSSLKRAVRMEKVARGQKLVDSMLAVCSES